MCCPFMSGPKRGARLAAAQLVGPSVSGSVLLPDESAGSLLARWAGNEPSV